MGRPGWGGGKMSLQDRMNLIRNPGQAPPKFISQRMGNATVPVLNPAYTKWQQSEAGQKAMAEQRKTGTIEGVSQTAMEETQRRAAEDRKLALAGVTEREIKALDAIENGRASALDAITSGRTDALDAIKAGALRGIEMFAGTEELLAQARAEVSPEREAEMYEQQRTGIEAGTQAGQRQLQEAYARGGAPGGAMMRMMGDVRSAGTGQLSEVQRQINLDRFQKLSGLTGMSAGIAGQKADIYGQEGRSLANIHSQSGRSLADIYSQSSGREADIYGQTGRTMADIYGNTITAVPDYSSIPNLGRSGGTTVSGGSMRTSTAPRRSSSGGFGTKSWNPGGVTWAKTKPGQPRRMTSAFGRTVGFG